MRRDALQVHIHWGIRTPWGAEQLLERAARAAARSEGVRGGELSIAVVGARRMRRLHQEFMGVDAPTDVLTFDLGGSADAGLIEGEVIVCSDVALRRAHRQDADHAAARAELALYVVHGVLHLVGYDDHDPHDYAAMHAREDAILRRLGLGPVFSAGN